MEAENSKKNHKENKKGGLGLFTVLAASAVLGVSAFANDSTYYTDLLDDSEVITVYQKNDNGYVPLSNIYQEDVSNYTVILSEDTFFDSLQEMKFVSLISEEGNIINGYISPEHIDQDNKKSIEEIKKGDFVTNISIVTSPQGAIVSKEAKKSSQESSQKTLDTGSFVLSSGIEKTTIDGKKWKEIIYYENNNIKTGYVSSDVILDVENKDFENARTEVAVSELNFRNGPSVQDESIAKLNAGDKIIIVENMPSKKMEKNDWVYAACKVGDEIKLGWCAINEKGLNGITATYVKETSQISTQTLPESEPQHGISDLVNITNSNSTKRTIDIFSEGEVEGYVGLDINPGNGMTPELLRKILSGEESNYTIAYNEKGERITAGYLETTGKFKQPDYIYIKLDATGWGDKFDIVHKTDEKYFKNLKGFVQVCEEFGVPFGFYYYSQSITVDEAKQEESYIVDTLFRRLNIEQYNCHVLPFAYDVENETERYATFMKKYESRKEGKIEFTNLKNDAMNRLRNLLDYEVVLYTNHNMLKNFFIYDNLDEQNKNLWMVDPTNAHSKDFESLIPLENIENRQLVLDTRIDGVLVDINFMCSDVFEKYKGDINKRSQDFSFDFEHNVDNDKKGFSFDIADLFR